MEDSESPGARTGHSTHPSRMRPRPAGALLAVAFGMTLIAGAGDVAAGDVSVVPVARRPAEADVARFLEQATMGPTEALVARVSSIGFPAWLDEQLATAPSTYPDLPQMPLSQQTGCPEGSAATCVRDNYSMYPLQVRFFRNALAGEDQLRQRVALALHEVLVVSGVKLRQPSLVGPYLDMLQRNALGSYRTLLGELTLAPAMGVYLDMVNNEAASAPAFVPPDENYARELLQLFSVGVHLLNEDGTPVLDAEGKPVPAYGPETIRGFARVFTGWTFATATGNAPKRTNPANWKAPLWLFRNPAGLDAAHDKGEKRLLDYPGAPHAVLPAGQDGLVDLDQALDNVFHHPNVGPFVGRRLIQHLVTSNPRPAYVARVARAFADDGRGVRGNLGAVVRAILLDPEARGPARREPDYGRLREPVLFVTNLCRALGATSDGVLAAQATAMGQNLWNPQTVFSYWPHDYEVVSGVQGPEFGIHSSTAAIARLNFVAGLVSTGFGRGSETGGTAVDLSRFTPLAGDPAALVSVFDRLLLHGTMTGEAARAATAAVAAVPAASPLGRVQTAAYLVAGSSDYQVAR